MAEPLRSQLLDSLLTVTSLLQGDMERDLAGRGLTPARMHVLWLLRGGAQRTQGALATELGVTPRNVTGLVDGLEATGFVARHPHPTDRRATVVTLTDLGLATIAQTEAARAALELALVAGMTDEQVRSLVRGLGTVIGTLAGLIEDHAQQQGGDRA